VPACGFLRGPAGGRPSGGRENPLFLGILRLRGAFRCRDPRPAGAKGSAEAS
jgi:hypothetical protein